MATGTHIRPNGRVGTFTLLAGAGAAVVEAALDWARTCLAPAIEPAPTMPSVLKKSRREIVFSFMDSLIGINPLPCVTAVWFWIRFLR